jgi:TatD DNase family protein
LEWRRSRSRHVELIDTHAHLDHPCFDGDRAEVMARAAAQGVHGVFVPATQASGWARLSALATEFGWRYGVGTHPYALPFSREIPAELGGAHAVGECGLDRDVPVEIAEQERVLEAHLALAKENAVPIILHCWRAHDRLLPILRRFGQVRGVLHSYSGGAELVPAYINVGLHLSFTAMICREQARRPHAALLAVPASRLLLETDCPDQSLGGGRNEPAAVLEVLGAAESLRGEPLRARLTANAVELGLAVDMRSV